MQTVRPVRWWLLVAVVGVVVVVGMRLAGGGGRSSGSEVTESTPSADGVVGEFIQLQADRARALDAWVDAHSGSFAAFLPVSSRVIAEEGRVEARARVLGGGGIGAAGCATPDVDLCRLLDAFRELVDQERFQLGMIERAKRLDRRAEAYRAFTAVRARNCDYAGEVVGLLTRPAASSIPLSRRLPTLRAQAYRVALASCDKTRSSDQPLLRKARSAHARPASWPPVALRLDPPAEEWRIYAAAVDRSAARVEKVLFDVQDGLEALNEGSLPPEVFADLAGPDPIAAQSEVDLSAPRVIKDRTWIGRLVEATRIVIELGPPADPQVRRAWRAYQDALDGYARAVHHAAQSAVGGGDPAGSMQATLAQANSRVVGALAAFSRHRR